MAQPATAYGSYRPNRTSRRKNKRPGNRFRLSPGPISAPKKPPAMGLAPAPKPPTQPLHPDVVNAQITANRNVGLGDLNATWQQANLDSEYGFGAGGAASPYSKAALLQESFNRSRLGTTNSYASQGQLHSGAYGRAQNENQRNYDIGFDELRRAYDRMSGDIKFGQLQNYADAGSGVDDAAWQALLKALGKL